MVADAHPDGFLRALPPDVADALLGDARRRRFDRGDIVFHEGDTGDTLHVVTAGRFGIQTGTAEGDRVMLQIVVADEVFGELSIFGTDQQRTATVVTLEAGETRSVGAPSVREVCARVPEAASYFLRLLAERSVHHTTRLLEIVFVPAEIRVVRRIMELASTFPDGITLTQAQVGELACTSRATVNKVLRAEQERGVLDIERGMVVINDVEQLRVRAARGSVPPRESGPA
jgi:CRP/FNR family transcriptional regulator, cyclic AMP receptor protein